MAQNAKDIPNAARRIAIVGPDAWSMVRLREGLIRSLVARRHRVLCVCPQPSTSETIEIARLGADSAAWSPRSGALDVLAHRRSIEDLVRVLTDFRPYGVLGYGPMPMLFAALAGRRVGADRVVALVTSLAGLPQQDSEIGWSLRWLARSALRSADAIVCHNEPDAQRLAALRLLPGTVPVHIVPGGGVDLERFAFAALPPLDDGLVFAMVSRLDRGKGVLEFCEAAKRVRAKSEQARFVLAGPAASLGIDEVTAASGGAVELLGEVGDVRSVLTGAHVFVMPSHVEGMPRGVMEALATGRPVITSDIPGARETVDERVNGVLVPPGNVEALVAAMESFLKRPDLIAAMARASRLKAERRFDMRPVHATLHQVLVPLAAEGRIAS